MRLLTAVALFAGALAGVHAEDLADKPGAAADPAAVNTALFLKPPKLVTFFGPESVTNCSAISGGSPPGPFGDCFVPGSQPARCGCTPGFSVCPDGSFIQSCSALQFPSDPSPTNPGADWSIGTTSVDPEKNQCTAIWVNVAPVPRLSTMRVKAVCAAIEK